MKYVYVSFVTQIVQVEDFNCDKDPHLFYLFTRDFQKGTNLDI